MHAFIRLFAEIVSNTQAAVARFDDAIFQTFSRWHQRLHIHFSPNHYFGRAKLGRAARGHDSNGIRDRFPFRSHCYHRRIAASHVVVNSNNAIAFLPPRIPQVQPT